MIRYNLHIPKMVKNGKTLILYGLRSKLINSFNFKVGNKDNWLPNVYPIIKISITALPTMMNIKEYLELKIYSYGGAIAK